MSSNLLNYALKAFKSYTLKGGAQIFQKLPPRPPLKETLIYLYSKCEYCDDSFDSHS